MIGFKTKHNDDMKNLQNEYARFKSQDKHDAHIVKINTKKLILSDFVSEILLRFFVNLYDNYYVLFEF